MTYARRMAGIAVLVGARALAACDGGSIEPGGTGGAGGTGGQATVPAPIVPAAGQFVWTAGGVTISASDSLTLSGLKAVGYRLNGQGLVIEAMTEQLQDCSLVTPAASLPPPGIYPVGGYTAGTFEVVCTDPSSAVFSSIYVTGGNVVLTKAEINDVEGTFTVSGVPEAASGGFNVRCIYDDCKFPTR
jgi:hypothetical protein